MKDKKEYEKYAKRVRGYKDGSRPVPFEVWVVCQSVGHRVVGKINRIINK